jgi:hypothetical protein
MTSALALPKIALDDSAARGSRYTALDAWRGLAALSVVYGHQTAGRVGASLFIAFYLAVDFFFVLSGFVLAHRYWDELVRERKPFIAVVIARFARLYPAHVFVLFALLIGFGVEAIPAYRAGSPMLAAWSEAIPPFPGGPGLSTFISESAVAAKRRLDTQRTQMERPELVDLRRIRRFARRPRAGRDLAQAGSARRTRRRCVRQLRSRPGGQERRARRNV